MYGTDNVNSGKPTGGSVLGNQQVGASQSTTQQPSLATSSTPQIDITHIRSTTKFDHLQNTLQQEIQGLDTAILNQQTDCDQGLAEVLPNVKETGSQLAPAINYVSTKLDELESGLENDAEAIVSFRDTEMKQDEAELKCVFRNVDRLKVPRHYQMVGNPADNPSGGTSVLGSSTVNSTGLSGWWNQPQTLRGMRSTSGIGGQPLQLVAEDVDDGSASGPNTMVDLFDARAEAFKKVHEEQKRLLAEIEDFIEGLEDKVITKEQEVNEHLNYGNANAVERKEQERQRKMNQLGFVFGEVQRGLYEVADKIGTTRDGIVELGTMSMMR